MLQYFFRGVEEGVYPFQPYGPTHFLLIGLWLAGIILLFHYRETLHRTGWAKKLRIGLAAFLLIDQVVLNTWNIASGHFHIEMGLPFYPCRIAVILLSIACLFEADWAWPIGCTWGLMGSVAGTVMADPYQFVFPHYTNFQFFFVHIGMLWLILLRCAEKMHTTSKTGLKNMFLINNLFVFVSWIANLILNGMGHNANYGYLVEPPEFIMGILPGRNYMYTLLMLLLYNVFSYVLLVGSGVVLSKYYDIRFTAEPRTKLGWVKTES